MARDPLQLALLAYDGLCTFEFASMVELFGLERPEFDRWYRFRVAGLTPGPLRARGGFAVEASGTTALLDRAGTIVVPGWSTIDEPVPPGLIRKLRRAHEQGARILSVCSGVFVLAEAGLLDGRRATTHWLYTEALAERYPNIEVDPDVLYVDEGSVLTSAGSAAGIDLGLHLIRRDFGASAANIVARRLVVPPQREGGQKQFIHNPVPPAPSDDGLAAVLDRLRRSLDRSHTVDSMARLAGMSPRTFARQFKARTGSTPHRWLQAERVRWAQSLLESTERSIEDIALQVGFNDPQVLRAHFRRTVGTSPHDYRRTFRAGEGSGCAVG